MESGIDWEKYPEKDESVWADDPTGELQENFCN